MPPLSAMDLHISIEATPAERYSIRATGRDRNICEQLEENLILSTYREVLMANGCEAVPIALKIRNDIPIGKGCGSSAAARLAGIAVADHFGGLRWSSAQIVGEASRREHHPDNAAACWFGGLAVARMSSESEAEVACIQPKGTGPCCWQFPTIRYRPKLHVACCPPAIHAPTPLPTFRIQCFYSRHSRRDAAICCALPWKTAFTSRTALR